MKNICIIILVLISGNFVATFDISERRSRPYYINQLSNEYLDCDPRIDLTMIPNKCHSFRKCIKGKLYIMRCPYGTVFDESLKVCNFPSNIRGYCGNPSNLINMDIFKNKKKKF